jgi:signal transduction histidine kinase
MLYTPKILIVDDQPFICENLKALLVHHDPDYEIHSAGSGKEAVAFLDRVDFDLVLLDLVLPDIDGFQVMDIVARESPDALVIIMTGHASTESAIEALKRGAYYYLTKPFVHEELLKTVKNALDQRKLKAERERAEAELRRLSSKLLEAQEEERRRIGVELHDGVAQTLTAIKIWVETALFQMGKGNHEDVISLLENVVPAAQGAVKEIRRILKNLRPLMLDDLGILATISWVCEEFETLFSDVGIERQILKIVIFRVVQEALTNVVKHSNANLVRVSLRRENGKIELTVDDNGAGFDMEEMLSSEQSETGLGLGSMKERTELSGGSFLIESEKGTGTTVKASWDVRI